MWAKGLCKTHYRDKFYPSFKQRYGLSGEEYEAILAAQAGVCALCSKPPAADRRLCVDHDHTCCPGRTSCGLCIRGLLCNWCNTRVGQIEDTEWLQAAEEYLNYYRPVGV